MRNFFALLTIGFIIAGLFIPLAWIAAAVTGLLALGSAPPGRRPDGKRKSPGLLGGFIDDIAIGYKMMDCPYCKGKIMRDARKCQHCGEWVNKAD